MSNSRNAFNGYLLLGRFHSSASRRSVRSNPQTHDAKNQQRNRRQPKPIPQHLKQRPAMPRRHRRNHHRKGSSVASRFIRNFSAVIADRKKSIFGRPNHAEPVL